MQRSLPWYVGYPAWFVLLAIAGLMLSFTSTTFSAPDRYSGTVIAFNSSAGELDLIGANIKIAIGSAFPYTIQKEGEDPIEGKPAGLPLGWQFAEYYATPERAMASGVWTVTEGDRMGVLLISEMPMTLVVHKNQNSVFFANFFAIVVSGIVTFVSGMLIFTVLHPLPKSTR